MYCRVSETMPVQQKLLVEINGEGRLHSRRKCSIHTAHSCTNHLCRNPGPEASSHQHSSHSYSGTLKTKGEWPYRPAATTNWGGVSGSKQNIKRNLGLLRWGPMGQVSQFWHQFQFWRQVVSPGGQQMPDLISICYPVFGCSNLLHFINKLRRRGIIIHWPDSFSAGKNIVNLCKELLWITWPASSTVPVTATAVCQIPFIQLC